WRHLWKYLQVFRFDESDFDYRKKKFPLFVNAVLALRKSRDIRNSHLTLYEDYDCIDMWLHAAVGPHLQELSLTSDDPWVRVTLPPSLLMNCTNLVSLR
ncbi:F-box/RNI/FBD-like domain protein, partial [Trifolium medium]|nr:F-box/RNI/FBD-like domain protein [Trifolium medium]